MPFKVFIKVKSNTINRERSKDAHSDTAVEHGEAMHAVQSHRYLEYTLSGRVVWEEVEEDSRGDS